MTEEDVLVVVVEEDVEEERGFWRHVWDEVCSVREVVWRGVEGWFSF